VRRWEVAYEEMDSSVRERNVEFVKLKAGFEKDVELRLHVISVVKDCTCGS
jgi:hypothetical protein